MSSLIDSVMCRTDPKLPYEDNSFDVITNAVSVDYLAKPLEVFREMHRVLKPGGRAIMSFSNRCFPTKGTRAMSPAAAPALKPSRQCWQSLPGTYMRNVWTGLVLGVRMPG